MVKGGDMQGALKPGERVRVPFGLTVLEGEVRRVSRAGKYVWVLVAVDVDGADEPINSTYQLKDIERAAAA
jgi:hypothetical protein